MKLTKQLIVTLIEEIILESIRNKMKPIRTARAHEIVQWDLWTLLKSLENPGVVGGQTDLDAILELPSSQIRNLAIWTVRNGKEFPEDLRFHRKIFSKKKYVIAKQAYDKEMEFERRDK